MKKEEINELVDRSLETFLGNGFFSYYDDLMDYNKLELALKPLEIELSNDSPFYQTEDGRVLRTSRHIFHSFDELVDFIKSCVGKYKYYYIRSIMHMGSPFWVGDGKRYVHEIISIDYFKAN